MTFSCIYWEASFTTHSTEAFVLALKSLQFHKDDLQFVCSLQPSLQTAGCLIRFGVWGVCVGGGCSYILAQSSWSFSLCCMLLSQLYKAFALLKFWA